MQDLHTFAGAYALDALSETERRRFEVHLSGCESCAPEVRGLRETAARLALAVAQAPPVGLRERVLAEAARTRQLPPRIAEPPPRRGRGLSRLLAAACLVLAIVAGAVAIGSQQRANRAEALNREVATVLSAPDARAATGSARPGGTGTVVSSHSLGRVVVVMSGLAVLPSSKTYQLWLMGPDAARSVGLMRPPANGVASPVVADGLGDATRVGLTIEPAGGSHAPTSAPIFTAAVG